MKNHATTQKPARAGLRAGLPFNGPMFWQSRTPRFFENAEMQPRCGVLQWLKKPIAVFLQNLSSPGLSGTRIDRLFWLIRRSMPGGLVTFSQPKEKTG